MVLSRTLLLLISGMLGMCDSRSIASPLPSSVSFGHEALQYFFHNYTQFNHGAYGGTPVPVIDAQYQYVAKMEANISPWMNSATGYRQCILSAREELSKIIKASSKNDTVLVDNATEGINIILRTMEPPLGANEYIFDLSTEYSPFVELYDWLEARYGTKVLTAEVAFPVTDANSFIEPVKAMLEANTEALNIRIAVISHISAYPSVVLPVKELVELFHSYNIPVVVDGAHALGNIDINLGAMGEFDFASFHLSSLNMHAWMDVWCCCVTGDPDYYFANAHKWLFAPKSAAVLYVRNDHQLEYVPAPMLIDSAERQGAQASFPPLPNLTFIVGLFFRVHRPLHLDRNPGPHRLLCSGRRASVPRDPGRGGRHHEVHAAAGPARGRPARQPVAVASAGPRGYDELHDLHPSAHW